MATTFGEQIMQLALSMDIIDEQSLNEITELIDKYMRCIQEPERP